VVPEPIPPKDINLNVPMSDCAEEGVRNPTDNADPAAYM
jgi:hypothetical protein